MHNGQVKDERDTVSIFELGRWMLPAAVIALGLMLYFIFAPRTRTIVTPTTAETAAP